MATKAIVGQKVGMTQIWDDQNRMIPVTVLEVEPLRVVQIRTPEKDGYSALQVTFGHKKATKLTKPVAGQYGDVEPGERLVELRLDDVTGYEVGQEITVATLDRRRPHRRHRRQQGQGLRRRHEAPRLRRPARQPRCPPGPPCPRRHRPVRHAGPGVQGPAHGRPHGWRQGHHHEPHGRVRRRRARTCCSSRAPCPAPRVASCSSATP